MREHVSQWLNAYMDGELHGRHQRRIEEHLLDCQECRSELESLRAISALLQITAPARDFLPAREFTDRLILRLPRRAARPSQVRHPAQAAWWLVPAGLMGAWAFLETTSIITWIASLSQAAGLLGRAGTWLQVSSLPTSWFSTGLSLFGSSLPGAEQSLLGTLDQIATWGELLALPLIGFLIIALFYVTWLIAWWFKHGRYTVGGRSQSSLGPSL